MERLGIIGHDKALLEVQGQSVSNKGQDIYWNGDTATHTGNWANFVVLADTIVAAITDNGATATVGITGGTLPAGTFVAASGAFTSIELTSGTVSMGRI